MELEEINYLYLYLYLYVQCSRLWTLQTWIQFYTFIVLLHNGGSCNGCNTKKFLHFTEHYILNKCIKKQLVFITG